MPTERPFNTFSQFQSLSPRDDILHQSVYVFGDKPQFMLVGLPSKDKMILYEAIDREFFAKAGSTTITRYELFVGVRPVQKDQRRLSARHSNRLRPRNVDAGILYADPQRFPVSATPSVPAKRLLSLERTVQIREVDFLRRLCRIDRERHLPDLTVRAGPDNLVAANVPSPVPHDRQFVAKTFRR